MVFVRDDVAKSVTSNRIKWCISLNLLIFLYGEYSKILIKDFILFEYAIVGPVYQVISDLDYVIVVVNMTSDKRIQPRFQPSNKQGVVDLQLKYSDAFLKVKYFEEEIVFLNRPILLEPLIQNDQLICRLVNIDGFDSIICTLFFKADLDVEIAKVRFNFGDILGDNFILSIFLDLGKIEDFIIVFIQLTRGVADPLNLLKFIPVIFLLFLLDPVVKIIPMSKEHLQFLVEVDYFFA